MDPWAVVLQTVMVALAILQFWLYRRPTLILLRPVGRPMRIGHLYQTGVGLALAISPVGGWTADAWQSAEILTGVTGGLILSVILLFGARLTAAIPDYFHLPKSVLVAVGWIHNFVFFRQAPLLLLVVFHRAPVPVLASGCVLTAFATALLAHNAYVLRAPTQHFFEATYAMTLVAEPSEKRGMILYIWLHDAVLRNSRKPRLQLIFFLCLWAEITVKGLPWRDHSLAARKILLPYWSGLVGECIDLVEEHVAEPTVLGLKIRFNSARAVVLETTDHREEAIEAWREALRLTVQLGDHNATVMMKATLAGKEGVYLGNGEKAMAELDTLLADEDLPDQVRITVVFYAAHVAAALRDYPALLHHSDELKQLAHKITAKRKPWQRPMITCRGFEDQMWDKVIADMIRP